MAPSPRTTFERWSGATARLVLLLATLLLAPLPATAQPAADPAPAAASLLAPPALGSPRETLASIRAEARGAADDIKRALTIVKDDRSLIDAPQARALRASAARRLGRAMQALDLSQIPPAARENAGLASALMLAEILKRIPLPDPDTIPGAEAVTAGTAPAAWTIPGTPFRLVRNEALPGLVTYVLSPDSVAAIRRAYSLVSSAPILDGDGTDFYQMFLIAPGRLAPFDIYHLILSLPDWVRDVYWDQAVWQWIALAFLAAILWLAVAGVRRWDSRRAVSLNPRTRALSRLLLPLAILAAVFLFEHLADVVINITGAFLLKVELASETVNTLITAWLAVLAFNLAAELFVAPQQAGAGSQSLDSSLVRLAIRVVGFVAAGSILVYGASRIGIPVYGIVAGLGVGGLAIALAVRPTLENFIGGIILYADRPVKTGDFCRFGDMLGTVEMIGLRSTKIRALDRTLITVQNAEFAQMRIVNFTRRDRNLLHEVITLRYETTVEQLAAINVALEDMLREHPKVAEDTIRVRFKALGSYLLELEIFVYLLIPAWPEFLKEKEGILYRVMKIVEAHGARFALPSQTTYLTGDRSAGAGDGRGIDLAALTPDLHATVAASATERESAARGSAGA